MILTTFDLDEYVYAALQAGAAGFLLKDVSPEHLVGAVRTVAVGDALLAPSITRRLVERYASPPAAPTVAPETLARLTARETDVLRLLARGMSNAEIAEQLVVSEATVKTHVAGILAKLDLRNRAQAVVIAYEIRAGASEHGDIGRRLSGLGGLAARATAARATAAWRPAAIDPRPAVRRRSAPAWDRRPGTPHGTAGATCRAARCRGGPTRTGSAAPTGTRGRG